MATSCELQIGETILYQGAGDKFGTEYIYDGLCKVKINDEWVTGFIYRKPDQTYVTYIRPWTEFETKFKTKN